jgi:putative ABC transport system permease protein
MNHSLLAWDIVGLCLANGIVGFAAILFAQRSGYASINMGRGVAIAALAAIMLGESLFYNHTIKQGLIGCLLGTLILRLVRLLALNLGMPDGTLDLVTSSMVVVFYFLAKGRSEKGSGVLENIRV